MKVIEITDAGFVWHVPLSVIAADRARYYAEKDKDTTYEDEFDFVMDDHDEGLDWFLNNMNFADVSEAAMLVSVPAAKSGPGSNADYRVIVKASPPTPSAESASAARGETL